MSKTTIAAARPIDLVVNRLDARGYKPESTGPDQWRSRCPAHQGTSSNLSIKAAVDGTVLLHCFHVDDSGAGTCSAAAIAAALDLQLSDLFPANGDRPRPPAKAEPKPRPAKREKAQPRPYRSADLAVGSLIKKFGAPTARWIYNDPEGFELMRVYRFDKGGGDKEFRPVHPQPDGWYLGDPMGLLPLYHLDELATARIVMVTEGEKCADLVRGLGFAATTSAHGVECAVKTDWEPLAGKSVVILPDNDLPGDRYATAVAAILDDLDPKPDVRILKLPLGEKGDDIEQWLQSLPDAWSPEDCRRELNRLWSGIPVWAPPPPDEAAPEATAAGFANFRARIVREIVRHEAGETSRHVDVEAIHEDGTVATATVAAEDFEAMSWVPTKLGMKFVISSGRNTKERFQSAIRINSFKKGAVSQHVFTSLGWEVADGHTVYLHSGGAIGHNGKTDVAVDVTSELSLFRLPDPDPGRLAEAVERVVSIIDTLGEEAEMVAAIVMAMPYRAILGPTRAIPHFSGTTGTLKTSCACLSARFFAPGLEYSDSMPLSWSSTAAGLERLRHVAKDTLLVIDNLIADGDQASRDLYKADWVFNSQGDLMGKGRMQADGSSRPRLDPRGCVISTGECEPRRKSSAGRSIIVEFRPGLINLEGLKKCHDEARDGWHAMTIACYARYLAAPGRLGVHRTELRRLASIHQVAAMTSCPGCHPRHAEAVADWTAGWELFLRFAVEAGALAKEKSDAYFLRVRDRLFGTLSTQAEIQEEGDPGEIFVELLKSLLASKRVVLSGMDGRTPPSEIAAACGWIREESSLRDGTLVPVWEQPHGSAMIGWIDDGCVYLDKNTSHAAVERLARELGRVVGTQRQVLARLAETSRIKVEPQKEGERRRFTCRVQAEGIRRRCVCMPREELELVEVESVPAGDKPF
jgi:hypothetical protein